MQHVSRNGQGKEVMEYTNSEVSFAIDELVHSERDRAIMKRRLIDGLCFEPLAEEFDLSVRQVKNIVYRHRETIFLGIKQKRLKKAL